MSQEAPTSPTQYYRFPPNFWEKAGFSQIALTVNRLGWLAEDQESFFLGDLFRVGCYSLFVIGGCVGIIAVLGNYGNLDVLHFVGYLGGLLLFTAVFLFFMIDMIRDFGRDQRSGRVESFCGELTTWVDYNDAGVTDDLRGLEHGPHRVYLSGKAHSTLPSRAHYRIYFTPKQRNVVNVEEHTDDAPHSWPASS